MLSMTFFFVIPSGTFETLLREGGRRLEKHPPNYAQKRRRRFFARGWREREREGEDYNLNAFPGRFEGGGGGKGKSGGGWGERQSTQVGVGHSTNSWNEMYGKFQEKDIWVL